MTERDRYIAAILDNPADDLPRLAFADWLSENGQADYAEFIRFQIRAEAAKAAGGYDQESYEAANELHRRTVGTQWSRFPEGLLIPPVGWNFTRGMVSSFHCPLAIWLEYGPAIVRLQPIEMVRIEDRRPDSFANTFESDWFWVIDPREPGEPLSSDRSHFLPFELWEMLDNRKTSPSPRGRAARYETQKEALDALPRACIAWAKKQETP